MTHNKRLDIQGVRAWAVIAVVIFHFFPSVLPWGYLGVDVFFVLSGFLISLVLERKPCVLATYSDFYFKRFKRIFPLAILVTLLNLIVIYHITDWKEAKFGLKSALYALFFATNYNVRDEGEDYFEALDQANDTFTHYWSLSVEIQFYVLAPLLLHFLRPSLTNPSRLLFYQCFLALCSLVLSLCLRQEDAFSSTLCRLWQFTTGSMAFNLGNIMSEHQPLPEKEPTSDVTKPSRTIYCIPLLAVCMGAILMMTTTGDSVGLIRLAVTATAGFLLFAQLTTPLLCHPFMQLLGDASYALYLLHWPVVCALKDREVEDTTCLFFAMITCVFLSIIVHVTYEKWYLSLPNQRTIALVNLLYMLCFSVVILTAFRQPKAHQVNNGEFDPAEALLRWEPGSHHNFTEAQVRQMNKLLGAQLADSLTVPDCTPRVETEKNDRFKFCDFPKGRGDDSFLIIGNSYALSPGKLVLQHFKKHYGKIAIRAIPHCEPLHLTKHHMCKNIHQAHKKFLEDIEREKPDVLFISARYENPGAPIVGNITSDPTYLYMLDKLQTYEKIVKKKKKRKAKGLPIEGFMEEAILSDDEATQRRSIELAKHCEKCVFYNVRNRHLDENGHFKTVDPDTKLWYFEKSIHYTSVGIKVIEPVFTTMAKEYTRLLDAEYPDNIFELH